MCARILGFPIPTIAAVNGHAFAGGWILALLCDYRVMIDGVKRRAWACMNEIHFGVPLPRPFCVILKNKCVSPRVLQQTAIEGYRFTPQELLDNGMVNALASSTKELITLATEIGEEQGLRASSGVLGLIKVIQYCYRKFLLKILSSVQKDVYFDAFASFQENLAPKNARDEDRLVMSKL